jgi:VCBS repeat protein
VIARPTFILAIAFVVGLVACSPAPNRSENTSSTAAKTPSASLFRSQPIGDRPRKDERPQMSHVAMVDLDRDGLMDVLACDALRNVLVWVRQSPKGVFTEQTIAGVAAPAHVEAIDVDRDGDLDLVVGALGFLFPNNNRVGSVIVFENDGQQHFTSHYIADRVARVADARAADLDGDGDLDVSVAGFGYDAGETSWLENKGGWMFEQHGLQRLSGAINALPVDLDGNKTLDIVALISQEWEEIWAFVNDGKGAFTPRMLWGSTNPDFGSSWITIVDLDRDGDPDILYANGDAFEYAPPNSRPWQGIQWLENTGNLRFTFHRIIDLQGATSPQAADLDGDGDLDVLIVTSNNDWDNPQAPSLLWLENDGRQTFTMHPIASSPTHLLTVAVGDLDGDRKLDAVTGGMHISRPYDRIGRITAWFSTQPGR